MVNPARSCLTAYVGPPRGGCYERMVRLVHALGERGWTVHYVGILDPGIAAGDVRFHHVGGNGRGSSSVTTLARCLWRAAAVCWTERVRLVWTFGAAYAALLAPLRLLPRRRMLTFLRGSLVEQERAKGRKKGRIRLARLMEAVAGRVSHTMVAVSGELARRSRGGARVLPNDVSPLPVAGEGGQARGLFGLPPAAFIAGYAGSITPIKSLETLILAGAELPDVLVVLMGFSDDETPYEERIRGLVADRGLADRVRLLKWTHDASSYLAALDVVVLPSRHEGCPNLLLEAMARGRACLGAKAGGIPELLLHEELLHAPGDPHDLAARLRRLKEDPHELRRAQDLCRERARAFHFDWEERALGFFDELIPA